jgi:myo-inositol-1(or 4)-monophosphatase
MLKSTLIKAAQAGADVIRTYFNGEFKISVKSGGINDLVTEADHASEQAIFKVIQQDYPDHFILSEEAGELTMDSEYKWIIDPIDGTINFANGIPLCCVRCGICSYAQRILLCAKRLRSFPE